MKHWFSGRSVGRVRVSGAGGGGGSHSTSVASWSTSCGGVCGADAAALLFVTSWIKGSCRGARGAGVGRVVAESALCRGASRVVRGAGAGGDVAATFCALPSSCGCLLSVRPRLRDAGGSPGLVFLKIFSPVSLDRKVSAMTSQVALLKCCCCPSSKVRSLVHDEVSQVSRRVISSRRNFGGLCSRSSRLHMRRIRSASKDEARLSIT